MYPEMHPPQRLRHSTSWYPMLPQNYHLHMAAILIILFIVTFLAALNTSHPHRFCFHNPRLRCPA